MFKTQKLRFCALFIAFILSITFFTALISNRLQVYAGSEQVFTVVAPRNGKEVKLISNILRNIIENYEDDVPEKYAGLEEHYNNNNVTLKWDCSIESSVDFLVLVSTKKDLSNAKEYKTDSKELTIKNLFVATEYFWQIKAIDGENTVAVSDTYTFKTEEIVRTLDVGGISNVRDLGGWTTSDGKYRVKQGLLYRGGTPDDVNARGKGIFVDEMGVKTELDLRNGAEILDDNIFGEKVHYINVPGLQYQVSQVGSEEEIKAELEVFCDKNNYPIYFHCTAGTDRTGTLGFLLECLLGADKAHLFSDYKMSTITRRGVAVGDTYDYRMERFARLYDTIEWWIDDSHTLQQNAEQYFLDMGITKEQIQVIKDTMLEEITQETEPSGCGAVIDFSGMVFVFYIASIAFGLFILKSKVNK